VCSASAGSWSHAQRFWQMLQQTGQPSWHPGKSAAPCQGGPSRPSWSLHCCCPACSKHVMSSWDATGCYHHLAMSCADNHTYPIFPKTFKLACQEGDQLSSGAARAGLIHACLARHGTHKASQRVTLSCSLREATSRLELRL